MSRRLMAATAGALTSVLLIGGVSSAEASVHHSESQPAGLQWVASGVVTQGWESCIAAGPTVANQWAAEDWECRTYDDVGIKMQVWVLIYV